MHSLIPHSVGNFLLIFLKYQSIVSLSLWSASQMRATSKMCGRMRKVAGLLKRHYDLKQCEQHANILADFMN